MLNSRMQMKFKVFTRGTPFNEFCPLLDARAIWSWTAQASANVSFEKLTVANCTQEYAAKWLEKGSRCKWSLTLEDGSDILFHRYFVPSSGVAKGSELSHEEVTVTAECPHEGSFTSECEGVLWLCIDNYASWWNAKVVTLLLD